MHPILAARSRLILYLAAWELLAPLQVRLLTSSGGWNWQQAAAVAVPMCLLYAFMSLSAWYLCRFLPVRGVGVSRLLAANAAAAVLNSAVWVAAGRGIAWVSGVEERYWRSATLLFAAGVLLYLLAAAMYYILLTVDAWREAEAREAQARMLAREAELKALKAQVNPHFLFNSLHSISALAGTDAGRAREMCVLLGDFLRSSLGLGERERIPLEDELALARRFLAVEQVRLGPRLQVREQVEDGCGRCLVPPLLLQPLIENAIKHGVASLVEGGVVWLEIRRADGQVAIAVENTFDAEVPAARRGGLGLAIVRKRLDACYGTAARLDIRVTGNRYRAELQVPAGEEK